MKNIVLFRLKDDDAIWLADLEAGTVERTDAFEAGEGNSRRTAGRRSRIATIVALRCSVASVLRRAPTCRRRASTWRSPRRPAPMRRRIGSSRAATCRLQGVDMAVATSARSDAPSHQYFAQGVDMAVATSARSDAPSHQYFAQGVDMAVATSARSEAPSHQYFAKGVDMAIAATARADAPSHRFFPSS